VNVSHFTSDHALLSTILISLVPGKPMLISFTLV